MTAEEYNTACIHAKTVELKVSYSKDKVIQVVQNPDGSYEFQDELKRLFG